MKRYCEYIPEFDGVYNCGCVMQVDDFAPSSPSEDAEMLRATRHMSTVPVPHDSDDPWEVVLIGVESPEDDGFNYAALRAAADAYRLSHGLGCHVVEINGSDPDPTCCGEPVLVGTVCYDHAVGCEGCGEPVMPFGTCALCGGRARGKRKARGDA